MAIWRTCGEHRPLIGEFAYQFRFQDRSQLSPDALRRTEAFFISLQYAAEDYIALNCTKTATAYRLLGNPPSRTNNRAKPFGSPRGRTPKHE